LGLKEKEKNKQGEKEATTKEKVTFGVFYSSLLLLFAI
jgi:hypothetical protein